MLNKDGTAGTVRVLHDWDVDRIWRQLDWRVTTSAWHPGTRDSMCVITKLTYRERKDGKKGTVSRTLCGHDFPDTRVKLYDVRRPFCIGCVVTLHNRQNEWLTKTGQGKHPRRKHVPLLGTV